MRFYRIQNVWVNLDCVSGVIEMPDGSLKVAAGQMAVDIPLTERRAFLDRLEQVQSSPDLPAMVDVPGLREVAKAAQAVSDAAAVAASAMLPATGEIPCGKCGKLVPSERTAGMPFRWLCECDKALPS